MKKVKKLSALFLAMVMLFALVACGADPAADAGNEAENTNPDAENLVIKMGHAESDNENSCHHMADTKFAELVTSTAMGASPSRCSPTANSAANATWWRGCRSAL